MDEINKFTLVTTKIIVPGCPEIILEEQRLTINRTGHVWLSEYWYDIETGKIDDKNNEQLGVGKKNATIIFDYLSELIEEKSEEEFDPINDYWTLLYYSGGHEASVRGECGVTILKDGTNISAFIRELIGLPRLWIFDVPREEERKDSELIKQEDKNNSEKNNPIDFKPTIYSSNLINHFLKNEGGLLDDQENQMGHEWLIIDKLLDDYRIQFEDYIRRDEDNLFLPHSTLPEKDEKSFSEENWAEKYNHWDEEIIQDIEDCDAAESDTDCENDIINNNSHKNNHESNSNEINFQSYHAREIINSSNERKKSSPLMGWAIALLLFLGFCIYGTGLADNIVFFQEHEEQQNTQNDGYDIKQDYEPLLNDEYNTDYQEDKSAGFQAATIRRVVDGDTVDVLINGVNTRIRMIGVDTPESVHPDDSRNTAEGWEASNFTKSALPSGTTVFLEYDQDLYDTYGRTLAYIWLSDDVDPSNYSDFLKYNFEAILLQNTYCEPVYYAPNGKYKEWLESVAY